MIKSINIICLCVMLCSYLSAQKISELKWLEGNWKIETGQGTIIESWKIKNDSTLTGKSVFIAGKDTMPQEKIELAFLDGHWTYNPVIGGQSEANSAKFKVIFLNGTEFISENPEHDFPQRISYRRVKDQIFASIEGKNDGKYIKENFDFVRL